MPRRLLRRSSPENAVAVATAAVGLLVAAGCATVPRTNGINSAVRRVLEQQAEAWNQGDIETYMAGYWKSDALTFVSGGDVARGWQATIDRYRRRYPNRGAMGHLTFSELEVRELGPRAALVLGRWHLDREAPNKPVGGRFTLIFRRIDGAWGIVHDHTSTE